MSIIRRHNYDNNEITALANDTDDFEWIAYEGADDSCILKKVSAYNPELVYFSLTVTANKINRMKVSGDYLYCALDATDYIGVRFDTSDPIGDYDYIDTPGSVTEEAVDVGIGSTYWYLLTPGSASGENAKVIIVNGDTVSETVSLT